MDSVQNAKSSSRIKFTSITASSNYLVCGANTGSLYVFDRKSSEMLRLISNNEIPDPIHLLTMHPSNDDVLALASINSIYLIKLNLLERNANEKILLKISEHKSTVTCINWCNDSGLKLYSSDSEGHVCMTDAKKLVQKTVHLYKCDAPVIQLDSKADKQLIISSSTQVYLIDFEKSKATKVGTKPRNGSYGACFHPSQENLLLAARPGKNIWAASSDTSQVISTMKLKDSLQSLPNTTLLGRYLLPDTPVQKWNGVQIRRMEQFSEFIISWDRTCMIILDPTNGQIIQWHTDVALMSITTLKDAIFILHVNENEDTTVYRIDSLDSLEYSKSLYDRLSYDTRIHQNNGKDIQSLNLREYWFQCASYSIIGKNENITMLKEINDILLKFKELSESETSILDSLKDLIEKVEEKIKQQLEEERRIKEEQKLEEQRKLEEEIKKKEEAERLKKLAEEEEAKRQAEIKRKQEEEKKRLEEEEKARIKRKQEEEQRKEEERLRKLAEEAERRKKQEAEELKRIEQAERLRREALLGSAPSSDREDTFAIKSDKPVENIVSTIVDDDIEDTYEPAVINIAPAEPPSKKTKKKKKVIRKKKASTRVVDIAPATMRSPKPSPIIEQKKEEEVEKKSIIKEPSSSLSVNNSSVAVQKKPIEVEKPKQNEESDITSMLNDFSFGKLKRFTEKMASSLTPIHSVSDPSIDGLTSMSSEIISSSDPEPLKELPKVNDKHPKNSEPEIPIVTEKQIIESIEKEENIQKEEPKIIDEDELTLELYQKVSHIISIQSYTSVSSSSSVLLEDPCKISLPAELFSSLNDWIKLFNPSKPPPASKSVLSILISVCYEHNINDSIGPSPWSDNQSIQFLEQTIDYIIIPRVFYIANQSNFIDTLLFLLKKQENSKNNNDEWKSRESICKKLLSNLDKGDINSTITFINTKRDIGLILAILPKLLAISERHDAIISSLIKLYPALLPRNLYNYLSNDKFFNESSKLEIYRSQKLFIEYIKMIWIKYPELQQDQDIVYHWLKQCMSHEAPGKDVIYNNNGLPKIRTHLYPWGHLESMMKVLENPNEYRYNYNSIKILCEEKGFLPGLMYFYKRNDDILEALKLSLHTDNLEEFKSLTSSLPASHWKILLEEWENVDTSDSSRVLRCEQVITSLLQSLGSTDCIELLETIPNFAKVLPFNVYREILKVGQISIQQDNLLPKLLELINTHLWSNRPKELSPQIQYCLEKELNGGTLNYCDGDNSIPLPRFYEESQNHWGIPARVILGKCPSCMLPIIDSSSSVIVFQCGHVYHQQCIPEMACRECFEMDSLLNW